MVEELVECARFPFADVRIDDTAGQQQPCGGEGAGVRCKKSCGGERCVQRADMGPQSIDASCDEGLAGLDDLPGAERVSADDLSVWRYGECRHSAGRESSAGERDGTAGVWTGNAELEDMVQSGGVC